MVITHKKPEANMKRYVLQTGRCGTSILAGMAGLMLMAVSALGQLSLTDTTPIRINFNANSSPYANPIVVAGATGSVEFATVTLNAMTHGYVNAVSALLVGPAGGGGDSVVLMSAAGGNFPVNNVNLTFADNTTFITSGTLPQNSAIGSGTYVPANYFGPGLSFSSPAPTTGYATALSALACVSPNGTWTLYVMDDFPLYTGSINSWTLNLYTTPLIYPSTNSVTVNENSSASMKVTLLDSTPNATLTVSAVSDNRVSIDPTNIVITAPSGSPLTSTVTFSPHLDQFASANITLTVSDKTGGSTSTAPIPLAINHVIQAPTNSIYFDAYIPSPIFAATNLVAGNGQTGSITIPQGGISPVLTSVLTDPETSPNIVIIPVSSNPNIVSVAGVTFDNNTGSGLIRNFTIVPVPGAVGTATVQFLASDGQTRSWTNWAAVQVNVTGASHPVIGNPAPIAMYSSGVANDSINVSGVSGLIAKVTVSLLGMTNINPDDLTIGLQGPGGVVVPLVYAYPNSTVPQNWAEITLDDSVVAGLLPSATTITNWTMAPGFPFLSGTPASPGPFLGMNPNTTWTLYVTNGAAGPGAAIANGWLLNIYAAPTISSVATVNVAEESTTAINFNVADVDGTVTNVKAFIASVPSPVFPFTPPPLATAAVTAFNAGTATGTVTLTGNKNSPGSNVVTLVAEDNNGFFGTNTFNYNLAFVDHPPTITVILNQQTYQGAPIGPVSFSVGDLGGLDQLDLGHLTVLAYSDAVSQKVLPTSNIVLQQVADGFLTNYTLTIFPIAQGVANVLVTVSDSTPGTNSLTILGTRTTTNTFSVLVQPPAYVLASNLGGIPVAANSPATPYPSVINLSGLVGQVSHVQVTLFDIGYANPSKLNVLLVSPGATNVAYPPVLLMSGVGGSSPTANTTLLLDPSATSPLPSSGPLLSGAYQPANYSGYVQFPGYNTNNPLPGPYTTSLGSLNGSNPNGNWSLYVYDNGSAQGGSIGGGWQLTVLTSPNLQPIAGFSTPENTVGDVIVTVGDNEQNPSTTVTLSPSGTNSALIQSWTVSGSGAARTLAITPTPWTYGSDWITVTATDGVVTTTQGFLFTVNQALYAPFVTGLQGTVGTPAATPTTISFQVWSPQDNSHISIIPNSENPGILPNSNITVSGPTFFAAGPNGTGPTNTFTVTMLPAGVASGSVPVDLVITDGSKAGATKVSFTLNVLANLAYANPQAILIPPGLFPGSLPSAGEASPYPSVNTVSGVGGLVSGLTVTLLGFTHPYPANLDLMLEKYDAASGKTINVMLMSHAGGGLPANNLRIAFSDNGAAGPIPQSSQLTSATYQPFAWPGNSFTSVGAPFSSAFTTTLSSFDGIDPNGEWLLYVLDDTYTASGLIDGGWIISFQTSPTFAGLRGVIAAENSPQTIPLLLADSSSGNNGSNLTVTVTTANLNSPSPYSLANLIYQTNLVLTEITGTNRNLTVTPTANYPSAVSTNNGTNNITIDVTDGTYTYGQTIQFIVINQNQPPVITPSSNVVNIVENGGTTNIVFTVSDVDSMLSTTDNFNVVSSTASIVPNTSAGIAYVSGGFSPIAGTLGSSGTFTFAVTPAANAFGTDTITISLNDDHNNLTSTNITLNVIHTAQLPVISSSPSGYANIATNTYNVLVGTVTPPIPFYVSSVEGDVSAKELLVSAASGNTTIVPASSITLAQVNGGAWTIQFAPLGLSGASVPITLTVADPVNLRTNSATLNLTVAPSLQVPVFANTAPIAATGGAAIALYPSVITVAGLSNTVYQVQVILNGFTDSNPAADDVLLVPPSGKPVMLMSGMGGGAPADNLRLAIADGGVVVPLGGVLTSGTNAPEDYDNGANGQPTDVPVPPAPARPYNTALASLAGINPNGNWSLFVTNHQSGDLAQITGGWSLVLKTTPNLTVTSTSPALNGSGALTFPENGSATVNFTIEDISTAASNLIVTASCDNPRILSPSAFISQAGVAYSSSFSFSPSPVSATNMVLTIDPVADISGSCNLTLTVTRGDGASTSRTIPVVVTSVTVPVTVTRLLNLTNAENTVVKLDFIVSTFDTPLSKLSIGVTSTNSAVVAPSGIHLPNGTNYMIGLAANVAPSASDVTLQLNPVLNALGPTLIWVGVTNPGPEGVGAVVTLTNFWVDFTPVFGPPQFGATPDQSVSGGSTINVPFTVISLNTPTPNVTVTATSSDTTRVPNPVITPGTASGATPGTRSLSLMAVHGATGKVTITLTATDNTNTNLTSSASFTVSIRPSRDFLFANAPAMANGVLTNGIDINDFSPASPYPATVNVSGLQGPIQKLTVNVSGFEHSFPSDVGMLLVSPWGQNLVLQQNAGDGHAVSGLSLTFDQSASNALPQIAALATGSWQPADYKQASSPGYSFFAPAPPSPYTNSSLNVFNGQIPNGTWQLYVEDDVPQDFGAITGGWSLDITTSPLFQGLVNLTNSENTVTSEPFAVLDDTPSAPNFVFTYSSSNTGLVPNGTNVTFTGSGNNWNLNIFPAPNTTGLSTIALTATDGDGFAVTSSIIYVATAVNYPPVISAIADTSVTAGTVLTIPITYSDVGYNNSQLVVSFTSSNPNVLPASNIQLVGSTIQLAPEGTLPGSTEVSVQVSQPAGAGALSTSTSFKVSVLPSESPLAANTNEIVINPAAPSTPYPSQVTLSGLLPTIAKVTVTLQGFGQTFPSDVSVLLVNPEGQGVVLMSRAGFGYPVSNLRLTFDDASPNVLPQFSQLTSGSYQPNDYKTADIFYTFTNISGVASPAYAGAQQAISANPGYFTPGTPYPPPIPGQILYGHTLSSLIGSNPNGTWSLYVQDDQAASSGVIINGWSLDVETVGPMISAIGPQTVPENGTLTIPFTVLSLQTGSSNLLLSAATSQDNPSGLIASVAITGTNVNRNLVITPAANMPSLVTNGNGSDLITLTAIDVTNKYTNTLSFPLVVTYIDQAPVIVGLSNVTTAANVPLTAPFTVSDVNYPVTNLQLSVSLSTNLGAASIKGSGGNQEVVFDPNGTVGSAVATVTASDGTVSASVNFTITTTGGVPPTISAIPAQTIGENGTLPPLAFTVLNADLPTLSVTASANNPALVPSVVVGGTNGTNYTLTVSLAPNASGTSTVTVVASDQYGPSSSSFLLTVTPVYIPPVIQPIILVTTTANTPVTVPMLVTDPVVALSNLTYGFLVTANTGLVSTATFNVTGSNVLATIFPTTNKTGTAVMSFTASDGISTAAVSFAFIVNPPGPPSLGLISNVVTAANTPVPVPMVVTPGTVPLGQLTYSYQVSNSNLVSSIVFNTNAFPVRGATVTASINPAPNQAGSATVTIYVSDGVDTVSQSFLLTVLGTPPTLGPIANVSTPANTPVPVPMVVTPGTVPLAQLTFSYQVSNSNLVSSIVFNTNAFVVNGTNVTASIDPANNQAGTATVTFSVSDGGTTVSQSFTLTVQATPPTLAPIANVTTPVNIPVPVPMVVTPGTIPLGQLTFSYTVSNSNLVSGIVFNTNVFIPPSGATVTASIVPANNQGGAATVTFNVSDGLTTVSQSFVLSVLSTGPSFLPIASPVTTLANTPVQVPMVVTPGTVPLAQLSFSYQISNSNLVSGIVFNTNIFIPPSGATVTASIAPASNQAGSANVTFNVSDGITTVSQSFELVVTSSSGPTLGFVLVGKVLKITFTGVPNASYIIQGSSDLKTWTQLGSPITAGAGGQVEYDATVNGSGDEYFRALFQ